ncbi:hypothetical protein PsYK624_058500 [Phanerochaete sordida]|uniref:C2H2-type domain-containing protein n=1 Tax=Phanerochaete sordida TaxID=48140 RepID=A0A9P3G8G3_9APHY|nr:hypothetical protein PsYK624_058500 [Phanerochaete sordida]
MDHLSSADDSTDVSSSATGDNRGVGYLCTCGEGFRTEEEFTVHYRQHRIRVWICGFCGKQSQTEEGSWAHVRQHQAWQRAYGAGVREEQPPTDNSRERDGMWDMDRLRGAQ